MSRKNNNKIHSNLNKKKMSDKVPLSDILISKLLLFTLSIPICFYITIGLDLKLDILNFTIMLAFLILLFSFILGYVGLSELVYTPDVVHETNFLSKLTKILMPKGLKKEEKFLKQFKDIGYYFNEDTQFLEELVLENFVAFKDNKSLKNYINLINSDDSISKEYTKIITIANLPEVANLNTKDKAKITSDLFSKLIEVSIPKIIEYNNNCKDESGKINIVLDKSDGIKVFDKIRGYSYSMLCSIQDYFGEDTPPIILNILTIDNFLNTEKDIYNIDNYLALLIEFNKKLEIIYNKNVKNNVTKKNTIKKSINDLKSEVFEKYAEIIEY